VDLENEKLQGFGVEDLKVAASFEGVLGVFDLPDFGVFDPEEFKEGVVFEFHGYESM